MSDYSDKDIDSQPTETILTDLSLESISIEREKLKLETERLQIERDRLTSEREKLDFSATDRDDPQNLAFGITAICIVATVCLLLGGITGFTFGLDLGRRHTPQPKKLLVSREFIAMMKSVQGYQHSQIIDFKDVPWLPSRHRTERNSIIIIR